MANGFAKLIIADEPGKGKGKNWWGLRVVIVVIVVVVVVVVVVAYSPFLDLFTSKILNR